MIYQIYTVYLNFCWFISMALFNALGTIKPVLIVVPIIIGSAPFWIKKQVFDNNTGLKQQLSIMPIFWVLTGLLGGVFRFQGSGNPNHIAGYFIWLIILSFVFYCRRCLRISESGRKIIWVFIVVNGYFLLLISFFASMAISGTWI